MTTRKVMLIGRSHCITLPKEFAKELELQEGEELYIDLAGNIVVAGRVDTMARKEPVRSICKLLSYTIKIRSRLDEELEKYATGELPPYELISRVEEIRKSLQEIETSIKKLQKEKVEPLKVRFSLKFISSNINELLTGIQDLTEEAYSNALIALYSEVEKVFGERKVLSDVLHKFNETSKRSNEHAFEGLNAVRAKCESRLASVDKTCKMIGKLVENQPGHLTK